MSKGWTQMPSGRWVTTVQTKGGHMALHVTDMNPAWDAHRWSATLNGEEVDGGVTWGSLHDCMRQAEEWATQSTR